MYNTVNVIKEKQVGVSTTWTALRYGSENARGRKYLVIFNRGDTAIYYTGDSDNKNIRSTRFLAAGDQIVLPYSDKITVYARTKASGTKLIISEEIE